MDFCFVVFLVCISNNYPLSKMAENAIFSSSQPRENVGFVKHEENCVILVQKQQIGCRWETENEREANGRFKVSSDGSELCDLAVLAVYSVPMRSRK